MEVLRRVALVVAVPIGVVVALLVGVSVPFVSSCSYSERRVLAEFPQYGGKEIGEDIELLGTIPIFGSTMKGGCFAYYKTEASQSQVIAYFQEQLTVHGWKVQPVHGEPESGEDSPYQYLNAYRDGFHYWVISNPDEGTDMYVEVSR